MKNQARPDQLGQLLSMLGKLFPSMTVEQAQWLISNADKIGAMSVGLSEETTPWLQPLYVGSIQVRSHISATDLYRQTCADGTFKYVPTNLDHTLTDHGDRFSHYEFGRKGERRLVNIAIVKALGFSLWNEFNTALFKHGWQTANLTQYLFALRTGKLPHLSFWAANFDCVPPETSKVNLLRHNRADEEGGGIGMRQERDQDGRDMVPRDEKFLIIHDNLI